MTELLVDTKNKTVRVQLELLGEHEPIDIAITEYELHRNSRGARITIHRARASRQWMTTALEQFVIGKSFPIPAKAEPFLKLLG